MTNKLNKTNILEVSDVFANMIDTAKDFEGSDRGILISKDNQILERNIDFFYKKNIDFFYKNKSFKLTIAENDD